MLERAADQLERLSVQVAERGGLTAALAAPLAEDADFLRKVEPRRIAARIRGRTTGELGNTPEPAPRRRPERTAAGSRPGPVIVLVAALAAGFLLAKLVEWRSYAADR